MGAVCIKAGADAQLAGGGEGGDRVARGDGLCELGEEGVSLLRFVCACVRGERRGEAACTHLANDGVHCRTGWRGERGRK